MHLRGKKKAVEDSSNPSLAGPDPFQYCVSARERVWELAQLLLHNIRGNAGLGVS